jgi:release factor glutamine methyltransferase
MHDPSLTLGAAVLALQVRLAPGVTARSDAEALVGAAAGLTQAQLLARLREPLVATVERHLESLVLRRLAGEPLAYILGHAPFYGLSLVVSPDVLIPRPETELLAEWAIAWARRHGDCRTALDVGTGSGALALALASHLPRLEILGTDNSAAALEVARDNAARLDLADRVRFVTADLLPDQPLRFDLVVANLPYVGADDQDLAPEVRDWEPAGALFAGPDGLALIDRLLRRLPARLSATGALGLEIGWRQGAAVVALARAAFPDADIRLRPDLAGLDRLVTVERAP